MLNVSQFNTYTSLVLLYIRRNTVWKHSCSFFIAIKIESWVSALGLQFTAHNMSGNFRTINVSSTTLLQWNVNQNKKENAIEVPATSWLKICFMTCPSVLNEPKRNKSVEQVQHLSPDESNLHPRKKSPINSSQWQLIIY